MAWTPPTWEEIVDEHSARVFRLAYRLTGNRHDAEDLTQDVFVRVFRSLSLLQPRHVRGLAAPDHHQPVPRPGPPQAAHPLRRPRRRRRRAAPGPRADAAAGPRRPHLDADIQKALDALAPEYRAAVVLCDIEGLSYEEIAATLNVKMGTVRSRIHRGRAQLREALEHRRPAEADRGMIAAG